MGARGEVPERSTLPSGVLVIADFLLLSISVWDMLNLMWVGFFQKKETAARSTPPSGLDGITPEEKFYWDIP